MVSLQLVGWFCPVPIMPGLGRPGPFMPLCTSLKYCRPLSLLSMPARGSAGSGHRAFTQALRGLGPGETVEVPKTILRYLPPSYEETLLGTPPRLAVEGAHAQYRGPYNRHVYEKRNSWAVHRDMYDPRREPLEHLVSDAPEWAAAALAAVLLGIHARRSSYARNLQQGLDDADARRGAAIDGIAAGALAGAGAFVLVKIVKALLHED